MGAFMSIKKPRIALASYILSDTNMGQPGATYQNAVYRSGGLGFMTGAVLTEEEAEQVYQEYDGLLLTGGMDIGAEFLGEALHEKAIPAAHDRDVTEFLLAKRFMAGTKPILAICRGEQVLNAAMGGTHDQHIFDRPEVRIDHQNKDTRHPVSIVPGTLLSAIFPGKTELLVNSTHHQAVKELAQVFTLNAVSPDGVIEGYSYGDRVLATQFHPEKLIDEGMQPIFDWFVGKCAKKSYKVVTLCGSTRFREAFMEAQKRLTLEGCIVISVGLFGHSGDSEVWENTDEGTLTRTKEMLDDMHKRKIDMADEIYVINVGGYIGSSTRSEIEYAAAQGKAVNYLEPPETV